MVTKWNSIRDLKTKLLSSLNKPLTDLHLFFSTSPSELKDHVLLHDLGIEKSGYILHLVFDHQHDDNDNDDSDDNNDHDTRTKTTANEITLLPTHSLSTDSSTNHIVSIVKAGFLKHRLPTPTDSFDGTGGVYFLREANGSYCAVFKPHDEEQGMPNNPKNHSGNGICGLRESFEPGQGCLRELAAYLMDENHFCQVPATALVHCEHPAFHYPPSPTAATAGRGGGGGGMSANGSKGNDNHHKKLFPKFGSMQEYVTGGEPFDDIGPNLLRSSCSVSLSTGSLSLSLTLPAAILRSRRSPCLISVS
jgi:hypothetical protein